MAEQSRIEKGRRVNTTPDPLTVAETVLAPLRMIYCEGSPIIGQRPAAIFTSSEAFDAIVNLPVMVREWKLAAHRCGLYPGDSDVSTSEKWEAAQAKAA